MECQASFLSIFVSHQWLGTNHPDKTGPSWCGGTCWDTSRRFLKIPVDQTHEESDVLYPFFSATLPETNIAHENPISPGKYHQNDGFSVAMLVYRSVVLLCVNFGWSELDFL